MERVIAGFYLVDSPPRIEFNFFYFSSGKKREEQRRKEDQST